MDMEKRILAFLEQYDTVSIEKVEAGLMQYSIFNGEFAVFYKETLLAGGFRGEDVRMTEDPKGCSPKLFTMWKKDIAKYLRKIGA